MRVLVFIVIAMVVLKLLYDRQGAGDLMRVATNAASLPASAAPAQVSLSSKITVSRGQYTLSLFATYSMDALVLSAEDYALGRESDLAPVDLALGWGPMSVPANLKGISVTQSHRWYNYVYTDSAVLSDSQISGNSANTHIIPATEDIMRQLKKIRRGNRVQMTGYLANVTATDGWRWNSSTSRSDVGDGACELFYVTQIRVI